MYSLPGEELELKYLQKGAEELNISLQEYMLLRLLMRLDNLHVTAYCED